LSEANQYLPGATVEFAATEPKQIHYSKSIASLSECDTTVHLSPALRATFSLDAKLKRKASKSPHKMGERHIPLD
jgi:hypothetical protein